ncbi:hypothetical protein [Deinococcus aetherius]|nr:hypothetical protein [Deinococcus aetherius]
MQVTERVHRQVGRWGGDLPKQGPREHNDLRRCRDCYLDIATPDSTPLTLLPDIPQPQYLRSFKIVSPEVWKGFVEGVWTMMNTFRVDQMLEPGLLPIRPVERNTRSPHATSTRFAAQRLTAWVLGNQDDGFHSFSHRLRTTAATLQALIIKPNLTPNRRLMYLVWLTGRLVDDPPTEVLMHWPALVQHLSDRLLQDRPGPPAPSLPITLTTEQWEQMQPTLLLSPPIAGIDPREVFEFLLYRAALSLRNARMDLETSELTNKVRQVKLWSRSGQLGVALGVMHAHLREHITPQQSLASLAWADPEEDWRNHTARILLSDGLLELTRQVNTELHLTLLASLRELSRE